MNDNMELCNKIAETVSSCDSYSTIQPVKVGQSEYRNEFLLFVKPEIFMVEKAEPIKKTLELVFAKLNEFNVETNGMMIVGGKVLDQLEIMSSHYGFINRLSRSASKMLDRDDRTKMAEALGISLDGHEILGGHEYLIKYPNENALDLDQLWFSRKSIKLRSGFYFQAYKKGNENIILVNGFHPAQLSHFTEPSHRILLIMAHSNTDWVTLRDRMIGNTFPERAERESIRGTLYAQPRAFGLESVSIANNGIHMSAGPYEGMFEIANFFGKILKLNLEQEPPLLLQRMFEAGMERSQALSALANPMIPSDSKPIDLFTATESMDTGKAIAFWKEKL